MRMPWSPFFKHVVAIITDMSISDFLALVSRVHFKNFLCIWLGNKIYNVLFFWGGGGGFLKFLARKKVSAPAIYGCLE